MQTDFEIRLESPLSDAVLRLLESHYEDMFNHSPPESVHALDVAGLNHSDVTFWSAWSCNELAACAALKKLDSQSAELKSMKTAASFLRQGAGAKLLLHLLDEAKRLNYRKIYLETGSADVFYPARKLYANYGFVEVGPFADYELDPHSTFMCLELEPL